MQENAVVKGGFQKLLRRLAEEHEREVQGLRQEVARLQLGSEETFTLTIDDCGEKSQRGVADETVACLPLKGHVPAKANNFLPVDGREITEETPDLDALDKAFALSNSIELTTDFDEDNADSGNGMEEVTPFKDMVNGSIDGISESDSPLRPPHVGDNPAQEVMCDVFDEGVEAVASIRFTPVAPMEGWETLITAVQSKRVLDALPKLNTVSSLEESGFGAGNLKFDALLGTLAKELKNSGDNLPHSPGSLQRFSNSWDNFQKPISRFCQTQNLILHPTGKKRVCWDLMGILLLLHDLIFIPLQAFEGGTDGLPRQYDEFLKVLDYVGAVFWTSDIFVSFRTGYFSEEGFVEISPWKIARTYLKGWFGMDLLIVSTDWASMLMGMSEASGFMRLGKTVSRVMRVFRLLRFLKMNKPLKEAMERINSEKTLQVIGICKTLVFIVIFNHYIACGWFWLGSLGILDSSWPNKFLVNYPLSFSYAYATSLHWSLTQFTPASMEVVPQNVAERFFVIVVIILALVAFSSFVSSITAAMTHIRHINAKKMQLETAVREFFAEHKISHHMASRVWHFLRSSKGKSAKRLKEKDIPAFALLPQTIKEDLRLEVFYPILSVHPLFPELAKRDEYNHLLRIANTAITERSLTLGEQVFPNRTPVDHMVFVAFGDLKYTTLEEAMLGDESIGPIVRTGHWACEACLWADEVGLDGPLIPFAGPAEIVLLNAATFQRIVNAEGKSDFVCKYAELFMCSFADVAKSAMEGEEEVDVLFNDVEMIQDIVYETVCATTQDRTKSMRVSLRGPSQQESTE